LLTCFFFSSRRRHTRFSRDWSSDVCSSDLTGSDCVGTSNRHGATSVTQFELFPMPPEQRPAHQPWPFYPMILRTSTSHEEGAERSEERRVGKEWRSRQAPFESTEPSVYC